VALRITRAASHKSQPTICHKKVYLINACCLNWDLQDKTSEPRFPGLKDLQNNRTLRYIKWQCIIYIEIQEHDKLSDNVISLIREYLNSAFETEFKNMVYKILKSFYNINEEQFIDDIVEKVEVEEEKIKVRKYLEDIVKV
jgi:hypothetical protein